MIMAKVTIWQIRTEAKWYTKLEHRPYTILDVWLGIWPVAHGHQAGVVWTIDRWNSIRKDSAAWEGNGPNPYGGYDEHWKFTMSVGPLMYYPVEFWYALYVKDSQGITYWDNNNGRNYERIV
jgi:hypothetical protein